MQIIHKLGPYNFFKLLVKETKKIMFPLTLSFYLHLIFYFQQKWLYFFFFEKKMLTVQMHSKSFKLISYPKK